MSSVTAKEIIAYARSEEIIQNSSATGFTLLKFRRGAIDALAKECALQQIELWAAHEYAAIFHDITGGLRCTSLREWQIRETAEASARGIAGITPEMWQRYKQFSNHWSRQRKVNKNRLLSVFVAAVVDEQPLDHIAEDNGLSVLKTKQLIIQGLRDYARRAGWK